MGSESAPWKHSPGMTGKTDRVKAYTWKDGDIFVFKGGVTWDSTCFPDTMGGFGEVKGIVYTTEDTSKKAIFDLQGKEQSPAIYVWYRKSGFKISGIEIRNIKPPKNIGNAIGISLYRANNVVIENMYIHSWKPNSTSEYGMAAAILFNDCSTSTVRNCRLIGIDSGGAGIRSIGLLGFKNLIYNNVIAHCNAGISFTGTCDSSIIAGNDISYIIQGTFDKDYHTDAIMLHGKGSGEVYNNIIHDYNTIGVAAQRGNWKIYNNVMYNVPINGIGGLGVLWSANGVSCLECSLSVYNNFLEGGIQYVLNQGNPAKIGGFKIMNNVIGDKIFISDTVDNIIIDNNIYLHKSIYINYFGTILTVEQIRSKNWDKNSFYKSRTEFTIQGMPSVFNYYIKNGKNLSQYFNFDIKSKLRPKSDSAWCIGPYEIDIITNSQPSDARRPRVLSISQ
ncbi:MAG: right-handed parallel beta-helix repeat-containing protein [Fibrobacter sp.]|nr:right-handed parallel beta-helix repeat-containing protein [Fibrobacter sp.]